MSFNLQRAEPDGYTIAQLPQPVFRAPFMQKLLWDPIRDTTPIIQLSGVTFGMLVRTASTLRALDELFVFAGERPGELSIATNGVGTTPHGVLEELFTEHGLHYIHVPYKGTAELTIAVESGQVMVGLNSTGFGPLVHAGTSCLRHRAADDRPGMLAAADRADAATHGLYLLVSDRGSIGAVDHEHPGD